MWFTGVEVEQETNAPLPKKNPASAPGINGFLNKFLMGISATHAVHQMREALSL